jgi:hypothetical protein
MWPTFVGFQDKNGDRWKGARAHALKKKEEKKKNKKRDEMYQRLEKDEDVNVNENDNNDDDGDDDGKADLVNAYFPVLVWPEQARYDACLIIMIHALLLSLPELLIT